MYIWETGRSTTGRNTPVVLMSVCILWVCFCQYFILTDKNTSAFSYILIKVQPQFLCEYLVRYSHIDIEN